MALSFGILLLGALLVYSGFTGRSLAQTVRGEGNTGLKDADVGNVTTAAGGDAAGGTRQVDGHPVASWIAPVLAYARAHGWHGHVTSGYRTNSQQIAAAKNYGLGHYPNGPLESNHTKTRYPGGAVDVTDPGGLHEALIGYDGPHKLQWGIVMGDMAHFSATGH
jgi:hypothetical protein